MVSFCGTDSCSSAPHLGSLLVCFFFLCRMLTRFANKCKKHVVILVQKTVSTNRIDPFSKAANGQSSAHTTKMKHAKNITNAKDSTNLCAFTFEMNEFDVEAELDDAIVWILQNDRPRQEQRVRNRFNFHPDRFMIWFSAILNASLSLKHEKWLVCDVTSDVICCTPV